MDTQHSLPYRVLGSARGLACSTFSGAAGIEAELRDPRNGKQHGLTRVRKPGYSESDVKGQRQRQRKRSSAGSSKAFRAKPSASTARHAEEAFEHFQDGSSDHEAKERRQELEMQRLHPDLDLGCGYDWADFRDAQDVRSPSHPVPDVVLSTVGDRTGNTLSSLDPWDRMVICESFREGPCAYQEGSLDDKELRLPSATDRDGISNQDIDLDVHELAWSAGRRGLKSGSAAARRLNQIESHLLKFSNLECGINGQTQHTKGRMDSMLYQQSQHQQVQAIQAMHDRRAALHAARNETSYHPTTQHYDSTAQDVLEARQLAERQDQEEDEPEERLFRCPYFECHRKLQQIQSLHGSKTLKPCVHTGCNFLADSPSAWVEHVVSPHHDIQGGTPTAVEPDLEMTWVQKARDADDNAEADVDKDDPMET